MKRFLLLVVCFLAATAPPASAAVVTAAEYFINVDPGPGNGTVVPARSPGVTNTFAITIPPSVIAALADGVHTLACRVRDDEGNWSIAFSRSFFKESTTPTDLTPPTLSISAVAPDPRNSAVGSLSIVFSEPVTGLNLADLSLTRNGGANLLAASQTLTTTDNMTFVLGGLATLTGAAGDYTLTLRAANSGIADNAGNLLATDSVATWTVDRTPPAASIVAVTPDPRNSAVASLSIVFSEPVTGVDLADLSLARNTGAPNLLTASQTLRTADNTTFVLGGLTALTGVDGTYTVTLRAASSGIADNAGNLLAADSVESWAVDRTPPTASIAAVTPDPRNSGVASLSIVFSEPVAGLDLADLSFARNAGTNLLTASQTLSTADNTTFVLGGLSSLTGVDGTYTVTLRGANSGIADNAGNLLLTDAVETWVVDRTPPTASIAAISPNPRNSAVTDFSIVFSEAVSGFNAVDLLLTRNGEANLLSGSEALATLDNMSFTLSGMAGLTGPEGSYVLTLRATNSGVSDPVGNLLASDASTSWTVDQTPPTVRIAAVTPDPRNSAVSNISIVFSEPVTGLNGPDLALSRNNGANLLTGSETLSSGDDITFVLGWLAGLTTGDGPYRVTLRAAGSGISDAAGNSLADGASVTWTMAATLTVVAEYFIDTDPGPGNGTPVAVATPVWPLALSVDVPSSVIAALPDGTHFLTCRVRDGAGNWSIAFSRAFHKENLVEVPPALVEFIEMQWFLNGAAASDPVLARAAAPARVVSLVLEASIAGLTETGTYQLLVTPIDSRGNRGVGVSRSVFIDPSTLPQTLTLGALLRLPDGSVQLTFSGEAGRTYTLQGSSNLRDWIDLQTVASGSSTIQLTGANTSVPQQFFRLRTP